MNIEKKKFYKFFKDTGIIDSVNSSLYFNTYFDELKSTYSAYLDGAGMDYSIKTICITKEAINYNGSDITYRYKEETYSSADGYDPEKIEVGDLLKSESIRIDDKLITDNPEIANELAKLIVLNFNISEKLIDCYNNGNKEDVERIKSQINEIIRLDKQINDKNKKITSLKKDVFLLRKTIDSLENEKKEIENDRKEIKFKLLLNPENKVEKTDEKEENKKTIK